MKYTENDLNRIRNTVRNFNAKQRYNKHKTKGKGMLPARLSVREIIAKYSDKPRSELNKQLKLYQSFGSRESLDLAENSRLSKWETNFFQANREKTIKFFDDEIADLERIMGDDPYKHLRLNNRLINLKAMRKELDKSLESLTEDQIKGFRGYYNYAERSEIVKRQGFHLYLDQLDRTMKQLGYPKSERESLISKFDTLSENEFTEMVRQEDIIDSVYDLIDSPKGRGKYQLMADEKRARNRIEKIKSIADELVNKYKITSK